MNNTGCKAEVPDTEKVHFMVEWQVNEILEVVKSSFL